MISIKLMIMILIAKEPLIIMVITMSLIINIYMHHT